MTLHSIIAETISEAQQSGINDPDIIAGYVLTVLTEQGWNVTHDSEPVLAVKGS